MELVDSDVLSVEVKNEEIKKILRCSVRCKVVRCGLPYTYIRPYVRPYVRCRCNLAILNHTINKVAIIDLISVRPTPRGRSCTSLVE